MSAPEVRVDELSSGTWWAHCDHCGDEFVSYEDTDKYARAWAERHEATCPAIRLARLQARWDARNEALRALIEKWESTARVLSARYDDTGERELRGRSKALRIAADELERAIGGGQS